MSDSDDDITILEEKLVEDSTKKWKWKSPNPVLLKGDSERILQNVREKLNMQNMCILSKDTHGASPNVLSAVHESSDHFLTNNQEYKELNASDSNLMKTPTKQNETNIHVPLTPEQILELTENCLDSDNEPELTPVKEPFQTKQKQDSKSIGSKRTLNFNVRASSNVRNHASKFFGAGTSSVDVDEILIQGETSPSKSPSPKKKRLHKNSPIRLLPSHVQHKSPGKKGYPSPKKLSPGPKGSPQKKEFTVEDHLMIPEGPYYYEAFCFMIKKVCENPTYTHLFLETELNKLKEVYHTREEFQLYVRLMNRKDKWNRCSDIKYNDIAMDLTPLFDYLDSHGFISCDLKGEKLEDVLNLLKVEELKNVCTTFKVKKGKLKSETIDALVAMQKSQPTVLGGTSPLLKRFEEAKQLKQSLNNAIEIKNFGAVKDLVTKIMKEFASLRQLTSETNHILQLPTYLQRFCAGSVYATALTKSIEPLKQAKEYKRAIEVLDLLNDQRTYCPDYKGKWMLHKATILHVNLEDLVGASNVLFAALRNKHLLSPVDQMHLQERAEKVIKRKKNGLKSEQKNRLLNEMDTPREPPEAVEINARAYISSKPGLKKVYIRDTEDGKEFMSVEETVIAHYKSLGFSYGIHDEGSTISSLCLLSLWQNIYDATIPGVFQSPYQDKPLDWGRKGFYELRKDAIETRLSNILQQDLSSIAKELNDLRNENCLKTSVINWDRLERLDIEKFLECLSLPTFVAITRRFVQDFKSNRSGFPDLTIWSPPQKKCLFVEVKSPNDVLSTVQCLWLDFLKKCDAKAIVAHIRESGSKNSVRKK
ncbi:Fanconi-associated nuclease 1 [Frankliniella fusca]|uniref:Fanconi-associated nuclease n=1 Tax=Frankliniella fusca TaxID=407009 RepID=A0AAE1H0X4_9NEOP|nr:Fanconi-associated nuclease 1 [Frankliniella fusca]